MEQVQQNAKPMIAPIGFSPKKVSGTPEQKNIRHMIEKAEVQSSGRRRTFKFKVKK